MKPDEIAKALSKLKDFEHCHIRLNNIVDADIVRYVVFKVPSGFIYNTRSYNEDKHQYEITNSIFVPN